MKSPRRSWLIAERASARQKQCQENRLEISKEDAMAEKILLVDDDCNILDGYRRSLGREFLMETALGGEQALKLAADNGPYAVVVSDMRMPGMDGIQLLSSIKA